MRHYVENAFFNISEKFGTVPLEVHEAAKMIPEECFTESGEENKGHKKNRVKRA